MFEVVRELLVGAFGTLLMIAPPLLAIVAMALHFPFIIICSVRGGASPLTKPLIKTLLVAFLWSVMIFVIRLVLLTA